MCKQSLSRACADESVTGRYIYSLYFAIAAFTGLGDNGAWAQVLLRAMGC